MNNDDRNNEFLKKCREIDFSAESMNQEKNLADLKNMLETINNERTAKMNKKIKRPVAIAAVAAMILCLSVAVYGQELWRIIKTITVGQYFEYTVVEDSREFIPVPEELKGQLFDKDGNELEVFPEDRVFYNANGEEIGIIYDGGKCRVMTEEEFNATQIPKEFIFEDFDEGRSYFISDVLTPEYLPEGYMFSKIAYYGDPEDKSRTNMYSNKYMNIYYSDGENEIVMKLIYMDETTISGSKASKDIEEISVNGREAFIDGGRLDILLNDVLYRIYGNDDIGRDELVKIAESLK